MSTGHRSEVGRRVLDRRELLAGIALGALGTAGLGAAATRGTTEPFVGERSGPADGGAALRTVEYHLPAVGAENDGVVVPVTVELREGEGGILIDLEQVELRHDIQLALRESLATARRLTDRSLDGSHLNVSFGVDRGQVLAFHGKSWEAGLTMALVGLLRNRPLGAETLITGVVADDGTLLPVGGLAAKARAAREHGATRLLVPEQPTPEVSGIELRRVPSVEAAANLLFSAG